MAHIMLDLETFGTKPGCVIRSIGAVVFDPLSDELGKEFYRNIEHVSCEDAGLVVDKNTERWWAQQSIEAQESLLIDPAPLLDVVKAFTNWWNINNGVQVWSQGANFDSPLWEAACDAVNKRPPWKFWDARDTRTVYDIARFDARTLTREGSHHNALDDAKFQARCVRESIKALVGI